MIALTAVRRVISLLSLSNMMGRQAVSWGARQSPMWARTRPMAEMARSFTSWSRSVALRRVKQQS